jgi:hypothetical protein
MRAGVISSLWASEGETPIRPELERDLARILHRSMEAARTTFLDRALEAIDEYRKLERPSLEVGLSRDEKMSALAQAGREFATAVSALDDDARSLLVQKQRTVLGVVDIPSFDETAAAGKWACVTAKAADMLRRRRGKGSPSSIMAPLIQNIATAYVDYIGKRPSPAREAPFACALATLLAAAGLPEQGETAIRTALRAVPTTASSPRPQREFRTKTTRNSRKKL